MLTFNFEPIEHEPENVVVVRLTTEFWHDRRGTYAKKTLRYLRRKCVGFNCLEMDCDEVGPVEAFERITNLYECPDGIYEVAVCNEYRDWESGCVDDWDYKLVKHED